VRVAPVLLLLLLAVPAQAQLVSPQPQLPKPETEAPAPRSMIPADLAVLQVLDKVSARTTTLVVPVGSSAAFGLILIAVRSCQIAPPSEAPESAAFLEISEMDINSLPRSGGPVPAGLAQPMRLLYSGWMFASSPALSALEHPTYDVMVKVCQAKEVPPVPEATTDAPAEESATGEAPAAPED